MTKTEIINEYLLELESINDSNGISNMLKKLNVTFGKEKTSNIDLKAESVEYLKKIAKGSPTKYTKEDLMSDKNTLKAFLQRELINANGN